MEQHFATKQLKSDMNAIHLAACMLFVEMVNSLCLQEA